MVGIIAMFGTTQIAANAIANNLDGMGVLPGQAMNLAMITVVGRCVGAGDFDQAGYYAKKMMKITYLVNGLCCIAVILTMPLSLSLYGLSKEALELGAVLVLIHDGCAVFLWPSSFCLANVLRAASDVKFPMCVSILSMLLFPEVEYLQTTTMQQIILYLLLPAISFLHVLLYQDTRKRIYQLPVWNFPIQELFWQRNK